jgi:hypothetical protein
LNSKRLLLGLAILATIAGCDWLTGLGKSDSNLGNVSGIASTTPRINPNPAVARNSSTIAEVINSRVRVWDISGSTTTQRDFVSGVSGTQDGDILDITGCYRNSVCSGDSSIACHGNADCTGHGSCLASGTGYHRPITDSVRYRLEYDALSARWFFLATGKDDGPNGVAGSVCLAVSTSSSFSSTSSGWRAYFYDIADAPFCRSSEGSCSHSAYFLNAAIGMDNTVVTISGLPYSDDLAAGASSHFSCEAEGSIIAIKKSDLTLWASSPAATYYASTQASRCPNWGGGVRHCAAHTAIVCTGSGDCPSGDTCPQADSCVASAASCTTNSNCPGSQVCREGQCSIDDGARCDSNSGCPSGQTCQGGSCGVRCASTSDCPGNSFCKSGGNGGGNVVGPMFLTPVKSLDTSTAGHAKLVGIITPAADVVVDKNPNDGAEADLYTHCHGTGATPQLEFVDISVSGTTFTRTNGTINLNTGESFPCSRSFAPQGNTIEYLDERGQLANRAFFENAVARDNQIWAVATVGRDDLRHGRCGTSSTGTPASCKVDADCSGSSGKCDPIRRVCSGKGNLCGATGDHACDGGETCDMSKYYEGSVGGVNDVRVTAINYNTSVLAWQRKDGMLATAQFCSTTTATSCKVSSDCPSGETCAGPQESLFNPSVYIDASDNVLVGMNRAGIALPVQSVLTGHKPADAAGSLRNFTVIGSNGTNNALFAPLDQPIPYYFGRGTSLTGDPAGTSFVFGYVMPSTAAKTSYRTEVFRFTQSDLPS